MSFLLAISVYVSVWTFSGDNTWTPKEWREIFKSTQEFYKERLGVRLKVAKWRNRSLPEKCAKIFTYKHQIDFGNCLIHRTTKADDSFNLFLTPPIPTDTADTYVGGVATTGCYPISGTAMVHGKRISTHIFNDGGNAGWEMSRLAIIHESLHVLSAHHPEDVGRATPINIMDTEALGYLVDEYQIKNKITGEWENFRDALPLAKFSRNEVRKCLNDSSS